MNAQPAADSPWKKAMALLDETPEEWQTLHRATIIDLFREAYRITVRWQFIVARNNMQMLSHSLTHSLSLCQWSQPNTAAVLASVSNYMVMDDHEICNNWGDFLEVSGVLG